MRPASLSWLAAAALLGLSSTPALADHGLVMKIGGGVGEIVGGAGEIEEGERLFFPAWVGIGTQFGQHFQLDIEASYAHFLKIWGTVNLSYRFFEPDFWLRPYISFGLGGGLFWWDEHGEDNHGESGPFLMQVGAGAAFVLTDRLSLTAELRALYGVPDHADDAASLLFLVGVQTGFFESRDAGERGEEPIAKPAEFGWRMLLMEDQSGAWPGALEFSAGLMTRWGVFETGSKNHLAFSPELSASVFLGEFSIGATVLGFAFLERFVFGNPSVSLGYRHCFTGEGLCVGGTLTAAVGTADWDSMETNEEACLYSGSLYPDQFSLGGGTFFSRLLLVGSYHSRYFHAQVETGVLISVIEDAQCQDETLWVFNAALGVSVVDWLSVVMESQNMLACISDIRGRSDFDAGLRMRFGRFSPVCGILVGLAPHVSTPMWFVGLDVDI